MSYAGDITPEQAWKLLSDNPQAVLVDVRTDAEWRFVGVPDLSSLGRDVVYIEWNGVDGQRNENFLDELSEKVPGDGEDRPVVFLCRSGNRSTTSTLHKRDTPHRAAMTTDCHGANRPRRHQRHRLVSAHRHLTLKPGAQHDHLLRIRRLSGSTSPPIGGLRVPAANVRIRGPAFPAGRCHRAVQDGQTSIDDQRETVDRHARATSPDGSGGPLRDYLCPVANPAAFRQQTPTRR